MEKILVTGANGQLGHEMQNLIEQNDRYCGIFADHKELDITNAEHVNDFFNSHRPNYVVNCAAYTAVDKAEDDAERCHVLNCEAVGILAQAARNNGTKMVHVSTDYVFNGCGYRPYREDDDPDPQSVYGSTKLEGEQMLLATLPSAVIVRTAWLYSPYGKNFVKTMLNLGATKPELKVVCDQVGTPTYALDLAKAIMAIIGAQKWKGGVYHFSDEGAISWYDFSKAIMRLGGLNSCDVKPCMSDQYPAKAHRPHYSVLDKSLIKTIFGIEIPYWEDSLANCIKRLNETKE